MALSRCGGASNKPKPSLATRAITSAVTPPQGHASPTQSSRPVRLESDFQPPPLEIVEALSRLKLYRLQEQARLEATAGNYEQAVEHLTRLATHLLSQGERELAKTVLIEAENLQKDKSFSQQGAKAIKYGTRALLMTGAREEEI